VSSMDLHFPPWFPETRAIRVPAQIAIRVRALRAVAIALALALRRLEARRNNVEERSTPVPAEARNSIPRTMPGEMSFNLDFLRSAAVLLVVGFHFAKLFNWQFGRLRVTDIGLLGVMLFFVHTTLVLMFSLERQRAKSTAPLFFPFMVRRCFRIYPLAILVVTFVYLFRIPSDLQFGRFDLLHQNSGNLMANLLLIQNVTLQKANPGPLWSLPLEIQMYLVLPALFLFASRSKSSWGVIVFWWSAVAMWYLAGFSTGMLPLSEGGGPIAGGSAPEIYPVCALFSSRRCRLQTLAPPPGATRLFVARVSAALLGGVRTVLRKRAHPNRLVHLLWHRIGSMPIPGVA